MSDKLNNNFKKQKCEDDEIKQKNNFQACAANNLNTYFYNESDFGGSSLALTIRDCLNSDIISVDEWLSDKLDLRSCFDVYSSDNDLVQSNDIHLPELTSCDIGGYCVIDNFGKYHTVTRNIASNLQSVNRDSQKLRLRNDTTNDLQCSQKSVSSCNDVISSSSRSILISNIENRTNKSLDLKKNDFESLGKPCKDDFESVNKVEKPILIRSSKDFKLINLKKSVSISPSISTMHSSSDLLSENLSNVQKNTVARKIINKNKLPIIHQIKLQTRTSDIKRPGDSLNNRHKLPNGTIILKKFKFRKGNSILKCNSAKQSAVQEYKKDNLKVVFENAESTDRGFKQMDSGIKEITSSSVINNNISKKQNAPLAVVAISTNKSEDTTEVIIKTDKGEERYKGKTSEMMKATKNNYSFNICKKGNSNKTGKNVIEDDDHVTKALKSVGLDINSYGQILSISGEVMTYMCPIEGCEFMIEKLRLMNIHVLAHYNLRPFKCDYEGCTWSFYSNYRLKRHKDTHLKNKHFKCNYKSCERTFTTIYNLNTHLKLHERPAVMKCFVDGCEETFQTKRTLELHLKSHGKIHAPYVCKIEGCGKHYYSANSLQAHSRTHKHSIDDLKCEYCNKVFDKPCRLKAHLRIHTGVKPYKCTFEGCDWAFATSSKLRRHEHKHTQIRKFTCNLCLKSFLRGEHLKDHCMKHFICKSFLCPIAGCGMNFKNRSSVYAHLKKRHQTTPDSPFKPVFYDDWPVALIQTNNNNNNNNNNNLKDCAADQITEQPESSSLDSIEVLNEENLISSMESLQYHDDVNVCRSTSVSTSALGFNAESLLAELPDLINNYNQQIDSDYNTGINNQSVITHVVVAETKEDEHQDIIHQGFEPDSDLMTLNHGSIGSARTGLTYQETLQDRERRKNKDSRKGSNYRKRYVLNSSQEKPKGLCLDSPCKQHPGLRVACDVVLSTGLLGGSQDNLTRSLLLQDELSSGDIYGSNQIQEETSLLGSSGELLCEDPSPRHSDFEQSTINLRDLE